MIKSFYLLDMKKILTIIVLLYFHVFVFGQEKQDAAYSEKYRPQFHFSPPKNWINDPNGLVYFDGEYHLFFQYNPFGNVWGHMTWGHAVSTNLINWSHLPPAIPEENGIMIFSGTVVVDKTNSSGFAGNTGKVPMVAIYTGHREGINQSQHLAYSLDKGRTWTKYDKNPILDLGKKDFRDPKVFWYEPDNKWVMVVALPLEKKIQFYRSQNLKDWTYMSDFGPAGDTSGIWECPDLFRVPVQHSRNEYKWVLMHSPAPYMQYFVGDFNGTSFKNENPFNNILRPDYGPDYYAAIVYNNLPEGSPPVSIGWINNWNYANEIPVTPWKGAMSIPRTIQVKKTDSSWIMIQSPVASLEKQRSSPVPMEKGVINKSRILQGIGNAWELDMELMLPKTGKTGLRIGEKNKPVCEIYYDPGTRELYLDRGPGNDFHILAFEKLNQFHVPLSLPDNKLALHVFFDNSIVEVFIKGGERVMTAQLFPEQKNTAIELFSEDPGARINKLLAWNILSVWQK
jgi:fructan beta-fructosidase